MILLVHWSLQGTNSVFSVAFFFFFAHDNYSVPSVGSSNQLFSAKNLFILYSSAESQWL